MRPRKAPEISAGGARSSVKAPSSRALAFILLCSTITNKHVGRQGGQLSAQIATQGNCSSPEVRAKARGPTAKLQSRDLKLCLLILPCRVPGICRRACRTEEGAVWLCGGTSHAESPLVSLHTGSGHAGERPAGWRPGFQPELGHWDVSTGRLWPQPQGPR